MLIIFDKDNTLVAGLQGQPPNTPAEQIVMPGVVERLAKLRARGHTLALATNQGGVAWGFISLTTAYRLAHDAAEKVGGLDAVAVCPYYPGARGGAVRPQYARSSDRRKPAPGMIVDLMRRFDVGPDETLCVGDSQVDQMAAEAADARFEWAWDFFGWNQ